MSDVRIVESTKTTSWKEAKPERKDQSPHSKQTSVASWRLTVGGRGDNSGCGSLITMCSQPVRRNIFSGFFDLRSSAEEMLPCCDPTDQLQRPCWRSSHWPCFTRCKHGQCGPVPWLSLAHPVILGQSGWKRLVVGELFVMDQREFWARHQSELNTVPYQAKSTSSAEFYRHIYMCILNLS